MLTSAILCIHLKSLRYFTHLIDAIAHHLNGTYRLCYASASGISIAQDDELLEVDEELACLLVSIGLCFAWRF